ncbi:MAG TPA: class I SAM-dependent methyltransferase [Myxococcaceae bacterium]|jgi:SAM-dependent methyltransferase
MIAEIAARVFRIRNATDYTRNLIDRGEIRVALDIGCGTESHLSQFRPRVRTVGLDGFEGALEDSRKKGVHDDYVLADILRTDPKEILARAGGEKFDLVTLYGVLEHFPKRQGWELLERCEELTSRYVLLETPNGFVEQGPEFGNEMQRHRSGWFPQELEGLGYQVHGTTGTRYLRGYVAGPKYDLKGTISVDYAISWLLRVNDHPGHAFNLVAIKDVRGVPARLHLSRKERFRLAREARL